MITKINATNGTDVFETLETDWAKAGVTLEVDVDVSNLNVYNSVVNGHVNNITSTIDIV